MLPKTHLATPHCAVSLEHPVLTSLLLLQGQASAEASSRGVPLSAAPQQLWLISNTASHPTDLHLLLRQCHIC